MKHYTVLKQECIDALNIKEDGIYVDATLGFGGDSKEILKRIKRGKLFAFDRDIEACNYSDEVLKSVGTNYKIFHHKFSQITESLKEENVFKVDGILFDLGVSSPQLDENRGFSFMRDEQLDMRMDKRDELTAFTVVNEYTKEELKRIFYEYGEEKRSSFIANQIVEERKKNVISTTFQLVECIKKAVGANYFFKTHPERNIFQAIRIEVNGELEDIKKAIPEAISLLNPGGRIVVVTFHSLEDRIIKKLFKQYSEIDEMVKGLPEIPEEYKPVLTIINKKPILPSEEELKENSRSRSAKLRIAERN